MDQAQMLVRKDLIGYRERVLLASFLMLLAAGEQTWGQQIANSPVPVKVKTTNTIATDVERRLSGMGYTGIVLQENNGSLIGTALKGKSAANVVFDHKGQLHIEMRNIKPRAKSTGIPKHASGGH